MLLGPFLNTLSHLVFRYAQETDISIAFVKFYQNIYS